MEVLGTVSNVPGRYIFYCPGCKFCHAIDTDPSKPKAWGFNGNMEKPTFTPSILVTYTTGAGEKEMICHSFIVDGVWQFLNDCTHELAGQNVPMVDWRTDEFDE